MLTSKRPDNVVDRRPAAPATLIAGSETIRKELGWEPKYPSIEAIVKPSGTGIRIIQTDTETDNN